MPAVHIPAKAVSIEYAHIHTNQTVNEEHGLSIEALRDVLVQYGAREAALLVMVDDYSFPDPTFDYEAFAAWLDSRGGKPDLIIRESQLIPVCDEVLTLIPDGNKLKTQLVDYIKAKKYPCSLFIAAWYLLRLGLIAHPVLDARYTAKQLLNILPASVEAVEQKGLEIIAATPHSAVIDRISYRWVESAVLSRGQV